MAERKLTAEEKAAADADEPTAGGTQAPSSTGSASGRVRLAPPPFTDEFHVGDVVIPAEGLDVDASTAQTYRESAERSGITLREL